MSYISSQVRYHSVLLELILDSGIEYNEALKRCTRWSLVPDNAITVETETSCIGDIARATRRSAARCYLIAQHIICFNPHSSVAPMQAVALVQRWNVILDIFSNPTITTRIFTLHHDTYDSPIDLLKPIDTPFEPLRRLSPSVTQLCDANGDHWDDLQLELLGRALFYECMPTDNFSGLDFTMIRNFHGKLIELIDYVSSPENQQAMRLAEVTLDPLECCGSISPQTVTTVIERERITSGVDVINEKIALIIPQLIHHAHSTPDMLKTLGFPTEDYTSHVTVIREDDAMDGTIAQPPELLHVGFDELNQVLRHELARGAGAGISNIGRGGRSLGRTFTESIEDQTSEVVSKVMAETKLPWHHYHPFCHPIAIRLLFIYLSMDLFERSFSMASVAVIFGWSCSWPVKSKSVLSNWITTHIPIRVIHDQVALCQSTITTQSFIVNLKPLLNDPQMKNKTLRDYGITTQWIEAMRNAMSHLQFLAHCNHEREILCEVSPDNPKVLYGYSNVRGAATRAAVALTQPLVFMKHDMVCPVEDINYMIRMRQNLMSGDTPNIPMRVVDGYIHHQGFYNPIINQKNTHLARAPGFGQRRPHEDLSPLMRYECIKWIVNGEHVSELDIMNCPALIDSSHKYKFLQIFSSLAMAGEVNRHADRMNLFQLMTQGLNPYFILEVRRDHLLADTLRELNKADPSALRKVLRVKFVNEEGIDEGGLRKEFFQLLIEELFNPLYGYFVKNAEGTLWLFNPALTDFEDLQNYVVVGLIFGLALYNGVLLNVKLPRAIFKLLLNIEVSMQDLAQIDYDVARSLWKIVAMTEEEFSCLDLTWCAESDRYGDTITSPLLADKGVDDVVAYDQRHKYIDAYVKWRCFKCIEKQLGCFRGGFYKVLSKALLGPLDLHPEELEDLVIGCQTLINLDEIIATSLYGDGYTDASQTVKDFWTVCREYEQSDLRKLLWFITGSDRLPVGGASEIRLTILRNCPDSELLPSAHTCFNYLMLPDYQNLEKLKIKLHIAIENAQGFGLQ